MKLSRLFLVGFVGLALLTVVFSTGTQSAAQNAAPVQNEIFDGKIVTVYMDDPLNGSGQVMKDARLEKIGDRWILLGTAVSTGQEGEWDEGLTSGIAWDAVTAFYIFTQAQFEEKLLNAPS